MTSRPTIDPTGETMSDTTDQPTRFTLKSLVIHPAFQVGKVTFPANLGLRIALLFAFVLVLVIVAALVA